MVQWVPHPSAGAVSPLHGHMHQAAMLDVPRDVPFASLLPLSSTSRAWQGGDLQPDAGQEEGWAPWRCWDFSKQWSHLCTIGLPKLAFGLLPSTVFPWHSMLQEKSSTSRAWIPADRFVGAGKCWGLSAPVLALAAFVGAPATQTACTQREKNFPLGKAEENA